MPAEQYRVGRAHVLRQLAGADSLYSTDALGVDANARAVANIEREIEALRDGKNQ